MRREFHRWVSSAALVSVLVPAAAMAGDRGSVIVDARAKLARLHQAASELNYQGTMVFSASGASSTSHVAHYCVGDQTYERIEALDGRQQKILRHNDAVYTLWPQSGVAVVEKREAMGARGSLMQSVETRALEQYELRAEGRERVAGRDAEVFLLVPRDELRFAQRLWADLASGLMLRADVLGPAKAVLESSFFSLVEIGIKPQPEAVLTPLRKLGGFKLLRAQHERTSLEAEGWSIGRMLPGFSLSSCVRRPLEAMAAGDVRVSEQMVQAVFSDGLTHVSLFIERFDANRHRKEMQAQMGATGTMMQRRGEHWLTAMGDVPLTTLKALLESIERRR